LLLSAGRAAIVRRGPTTPVRRTLLHAARSTGQTDGHHTVTQTLSHTMRAHLCAVAVGVWVMMRC